MDLPKGFYGITDERYGSIESAEKLIEFGAEIIQYRCKYKMDREKYEEALKIKDMIADKDIIYIIDDRVDLALAVGADGVHVGDKDMPPCSIRRIVPKDFIIGVSTHSIKDVLNADCCDYIGVGPVFYTTTKKDAQAALGVDEAKAMISASKFPVYLIGGINIDNIESVKNIGAYGFSSVSGVLNNDIKYFNRLMYIWNS